MFAFTKNFLLKINNCNDLFYHDKILKKLFHFISQDYKFIEYIRLDCM